MTPRRAVVVVGAGLGGLAAAVAAAEAGGDVVLLERGAGPGGATVDSAGWIWRAATLQQARRNAPGGDARVQAAVVQRLDQDLAWIAACGVRFRAAGTGRATTRGTRIDPPQALDALAARFASLGGSLLARTSCDGVVRSDDGRLRVTTSTGGFDAEAVVFAGGGYARDLDRIAAECGASASARGSWSLRTERGGDGSTIDAAVALGAARPVTTGEALVRLVPTIPGAADALPLAPFGELHVPGTLLLDANGDQVPAASHDWSGALADWRLATTTGSGRLELSRAALAARVHAGTVGAIVDAARDAGAEGGSTARGGCWLAVHAGFTHTRCGVQVDGAGRAEASHASEPLPRGVFAVGADAHGGDLGGIASGLAQALVLGRAAGRHAALGS